MDWINSATALIALITGIAGLISAAVTAYFAVKKVIAANKGKSLKEI
jgi:succinate-acetate transporter protein